MRILFDQGTPVPLRRSLADHHVQTAYELGWSTLNNGQLLSAAEAKGFDVFITTDSNIRYQQNLSSRKITLVVLSTTSWPRIREAAAIVARTITESRPGSYVELDIP